MKSKVLILGVVFVVFTSFYYLNLVLAATASTVPKENCYVLQSSDKTISISVAAYVGSAEDILLSKSIGNIINGYQSDVKGNVVSSWNVVGPCNGETVGYSALIASSPTPVTQTYTQAITPAYSQTNTPTATYTPTYTITPTPTPIPKPTPSVNGNVKFYASDINDPTKKVEIVNDPSKYYFNDNFYTWQDVKVVAKLNFNSPVTGKTLGATATFSIYNKFFDSTDKVNYDAKRTRFAPSNCVKSSDGKMVCTIKISCTVSSSTAECDATLSGTITRLGDSITVAIDSSYGSVSSKTISLGSCPYDSLCKGKTEAEDAYWNHPNQGVGKNLGRSYANAGPNPTTYAACELYDVCNPVLNKYTDEAETSCSSGASELLYKKCLYDYVVQVGLGPKGSVGAKKNVGNWMQDFWKQEVNYQGTLTSCSDSGEHSWLNPRSSYFLASGKNEPAWTSDSDFTKNNCQVYDLPAHVSVDVIHTGTCADYSIALTSLLRKSGFSSDETVSVGSLAPGQGHSYNVVKTPGSMNYKIVDTNVNMDQSYVSVSWAWYLTISSPEKCNFLDDMSDNFIFSPNTKFPDSSRIFPAGYNGLGKDKRVLIQGCECSGSVSAGSSANNDPMGLYVLYNLLGPVQIHWGDTPMIQNHPICCNKGDSVLYVDGVDVGCCSSKDKMVWGTGKNNQFAQGQPLKTNGCCTAGLSFTYSLGDPIGCCDPIKDTLVWGNGDYAQGKPQQWSTCCPKGSIEVHDEYGLPSCGEIKK